MRDWYILVLRGSSGPPKIFYTLSIKEYDYNISVSVSSLNLTKLTINSIYIYVSKLVYYGSILNNESHDIFVLFHKY